MQPIIELEPAPIRAEAVPADAVATAAPARPPNFTKSHIETLFCFSSGLAFLHKGILQCSLTLHHHPELIRKLLSRHCPQCPVYNQTQSQTKRSATM